jgi:hypothetical protein
MWPLATLLANLPLSIDPIIPAFEIASQPSMLKGDLIRRQSYSDLGLHVIVLQDGPSCLRSGLEWDVHRLGADWARTTI